MTRSAQKDLERHLLDRFREAYPDFPNGLIVATERPDFLITNDDAVVGIELRQLFHVAASAGRPSQLRGCLTRRVESEQESVLETAARLVDRAGCDPIHIMAKFTEEAPQGRKHREAHAMRISEYVLEATKRGTKRVRYWKEDGAPPGFPDHLHMLKARPLHGADRSFGTILATSSAPTLEPSELQSIIETKSEPNRVKAYRIRCTELWLLLVTDGYELSSTHMFSQETLEHEYSSPYDRTLLFDLDAKQCRELAGTANP